MKKFGLILICVVFMAAPAAALNLADNIVDTKLSNNVEGSYFTNGTQSAYLLSTANKQGNKVYGSGSFVSEVYEKAISGTAYASSDLITGNPALDSTDFGTGWSVK